jgi:hypothetical protein
MEFTEHQRLFLATICDYFHSNAKWPTYGFLDHALDDHEDLDVLVIGQELAQFMNESWGRPLSGWDPTVQAYLTVPVLYSCLSDGICPELAEDMDAFMQVVRLLIEKYRSGEENARITEAEVRNRFGMSDLMLRKVFLLVTSTGLSGGSGSNPTSSGDPVDWYIAVSPYTRNYKRVKTIEDYLATRSKLQTQASAAYPTMPTQLSIAFSPLGGHALSDEDTASAGSLGGTMAEGGAIVPLELVEGTRDYIAIVTREINKTYEVDCYDACAVMIRRLVETLLIEVYEAHGIEARIVEPSTRDYFALSKLIDKVRAETSLPLSRNTKKALRDLKDVGDLAAHNRRFIAVRDYIDELKLGLRVVVQELVYLMRPANTTST